MKITKDYLKRIIKEELDGVRSEQDNHQMSYRLYHRPINGSPEKAGTFSTKEEAVDAANQLMDATTRIGAWEQNKVSFVYPDFAEFGLKRGDVLEGQWIGGTGRDKEHVWIEGPGLPPPPVKRS